MIDNCNPGVFGLTEACRVGPEPKLGTAFVRHQLQEAGAARQKAASDQAKQAAVERRHSAIDRNAVQLPVPGIAEAAANTLHLAAYLDESNFPKATLVAAGLWPGFWNKQGNVANQIAKNHGMAERLLQMIDRFFRSHTERHFELPLAGGNLQSRLEDRLYREFSRRYTSLQGQEAHLYRGIRRAPGAETAAFIERAKYLENLTPILKVKNPQTGEIEEIMISYKYQSDKVKVTLTSSSGKTLEGSFDPEIVPMARDIAIFERYFDPQSAGAKSLRPKANAVVPHTAAKDSPAAVHTAPLTQAEQLTLELENSLKELYRKNADHPMSEGSFAEVVERANLLATTETSKVITNPLTGETAQISISIQHSENGIMAVLSGDGGKIVNYRFSPAYWGQPKMREDVLADYYWKLPRPAGTAAASPKLAGRGVPATTAQQRLPQPVATPAMRIGRPIANAELPSYEKYLQKLHAKYKAGTFSQEAFAAEVHSLNLRTTRSIATSVSHPATHQDDMITVSWEYGLDNIIVKATGNQGREVVETFEMSALGNPDRREGQLIDLYVKRYIAFPNRG